MAMQMDRSHSIESRQAREPHPGPMREIFVDAMRFWEPRRIVYNLLLTGVVVCWFVFTWPHFRPALTLESLFKFFILGVLANLCYCAAYLVDISMQCSPSRDSWRRGRWGLWVTGTILAFVFTNYWIADEIYAYVQ
jgi:hypothetical protein